MTEKFVSAAQLMGQVLGADGYPFIVTDHPFSSATTEELNERAARVAEECADHLLQAT
jgi:hypothetical protein